MVIVFRDQKRAVKLSYHSGEKLTLKRLSQLEKRGVPRGKPYAWGCVMWPCHQSQKVDRQPCLAPSSGWKSGSYGEALWSATSVPRGEHLDLVRPGLQDLKGLTKFPARNHNGIVVNNERDTPAPRCESHCILLERKLQKLPVL